MVFLVCMPATKYFQFAGHGYLCLLAMHLCGMQSVEDTPQALCVSKKRQFLQKLAAKVVDVVFIKPDNLDVLLKTAGVPPSQDVLCICKGGIIAV